MKTLGVFALAFICVTASPHLLGSKECTWGPSYWCSNLTAAAGCRAVRHCIQTVWVHKDYPKDTDSVCQTCKNMVKQARDQLESNETQEEIKEVFEGSCKLIPIKVINKECCKLADDFIPELIDTLASQMNPDTVCAVAGLCNNERYDKLIAEHSNDVVTKYPPPVKTDSCTGCHTVVDILEKRFTTMTKDDFLESLLQICGRMGSLADGCSEIVINYFNDIYAHTKKNFNSHNICLLTGECSAAFHVHPNIEITPMSAVGVVDKKDDLPCDLCKQLVAHLRDILIADTTEDEFKRVLEGLCKQTQGFKKQCLSIVEEYYTVVYKFLVSELNSTEICTLANICPINNDKIVPIFPLLPSETAANFKEQSKQVVRVGITKQDSNVRVIKPNTLFEQQSPDMMQLPIERMNRPNGNVYNKELCTFCEYFLHYAQQAITDPKTEEQIKQVIDKACTILPRSVNETCVEFVSTYSDMLVAILAQEIDPSIVCPLIQVCPAKNPENIEIFMQGTPKDKPNCPLCLLAVTKLEEMVKNERTRENIKTALNSLCSHLSGNVLEECQDFVNTYTDELVEMIVDEFKPQEVCVYLKLCKDDKPAPSIADLPINGMISTNEIPDFTANGKIIKPSHSLTNKPQCVLCEFVIEKLKTILKDKKEEDQIKEEIRYVCNHMPKSIKTECNGFIDKYADLIFSLIVSEARPDEICGIMGLCDKKATEFNMENVGSPQCTLCKLVMTQVEALMGKTSEADVKNALEKVCGILPKSKKQECDDFIKKYGDSIYNLLVLATSPAEICSMLLLCREEHKPEDLQFHINRCAVCESTAMIMKIILDNPNVDHTLEHVVEKSCRGLSDKHQKTCVKLLDEFGETIYTLLQHSKDSSQVCKAIDACGESVAKPVLVGANKCTFGPSYWCASQENANACGSGAIQHCKTVVWKGDAPK